MNEKAAVSVVIPCYRCKNTIRRALTSIAQQTVLPCEVIIIDDCSDDGSYQYLEKLAKEYNNLQLILKRLDENSGPAAARNYGWDMARFPYIAFLDADDSWHPQKFEIQYNWMIAHPDVEISGHERLVQENSDHYYMDTTKFNFRKNNENIVVTRVNKYSALLRNPFSTSTVMLKRSIQFRFDSDRYYSEDYLLWLKFVLSRKKVAKLNALLAYVHKRPYGEDGLSKDLIAMFKGNFNNFSRLYDTGLLTKPEELFCKGISFLKFIRRCILIFFLRLLRG